MTKCRSVDKKLQELRDLGIDPFGEKFERTGTAETLKAQWDQYAKEELAEKKRKVIR